MQKRSSKANRRNGVSAVRIVMLVVLVGAIGAGVFEYVQWNRRNTAEAALAKFDINPKRDPNDPKRIISMPDADVEPALRETIHSEVFGGAKPTEVSEDGRLMLKESWTFPGVFTNYVVDVNYNLVAEGVIDPASEEGKNQVYKYSFDHAETRNISHFASGDLIANKTFSPVPNYDPREVVSVGGGGFGAANMADDDSDGDQSGNDQSGDGQSGDDQTGNDQSGDDQSGDDQSGDDQSGDDQSGDDQTGDTQSGDDQSGDDEPPVSAPPKSGDDANKGDDGSGDSGSGDTGSGGSL